MKRITYSETGVNGSSVRADAPLSADLLSANRQLLERRATLRAPADPTDAAGQGEPVSAPAEPTPPPSLPELLAQLPEHLGWESATLSQALRRGRRDSAEKTTDQPLPSAPAREPDSAESTPIRSGQPTPAPVPSSPPDTLTTHPSLLLALLKTQHTAPGRVWLLCRHLDRAGRGWLPVETVPQELAGSPSNLRLGGRRRLRQLLEQGRGVFWEQDDRGRLWLYGAARVAANLGVERLSGQPIQLPLSAVTGSLGAFRAHCYAAFHSGRDRRPPDPPASGGPGQGGPPPGAAPSAPISRAALTRLTGVPARTQRAYDQRAGVQVRRNAALLGTYHLDSYQEAAVRFGRGLFRLCDRRGRHGRPGQTYTARQLPNSYHVPGHRPASRSRRRRLNRRLQLLVNFQAQGKCDRPAAARLYGRSAKELARARREAPLYWPAVTGSAHTALWYSRENSCL